MLPREYARLYDSYKDFSADGPSLAVAQAEAAEDRRKKAQEVTRLINVLQVIADTKAGVQSAADPQKDPRKVYWNQLMRAMARYA